MRSGRCSPWLVWRVPAAQTESASFRQLVGSAGCLVEPGAGEGGDDCGTAGGLDAAVAVAVAPDQRNVYVASRGTPLMGSNAVVEFARRSETGALRRIGCISDNGGDGRVGTDGFCRDGDALLGASAIAVSPDGRFVYVASTVSNGVAWFERDVESGSLVQRGGARTSRAWIAVVRSSGCSAPATSP